MPRLSYDTRVRLRRVVSVVIAFAAIFVAPSPAAPQLSTDNKLLLLGVSWIDSSTPSVLYTVDTGTGRAMQPRTTGCADLSGIVFDPTGTFLYAVTSFAAVPHANALVRVDPQTGATTLIGPTGLANMYEGDLTFDPTSGVLYALQDSNPLRSLYTLDIQTGTATLVGHVQPGEPTDLSTLAFDPAGNLFSIDTTNDMVLRIDKTNGTILSRTPISIPLGDVAGMAYHPLEERFYVADGHTNGTNTLYRFDPYSGQLTVIGPTEVPTGLSGLAFRPQQ
jgi:DNA-binding beta-propeller fold protein YncE